MSEHWTPGDVLDFELFLGEESENPSSQEQLRLWYRGYEGKKVPGRIFRTWLNFKRKNGIGVLPGKTIDRFYRLAGIILSVFGFLAGFGLGWGVLSYAGSQPVNLFPAMTVLIGIPFLSTLFSLITGFIPPAGGRSRRMMDRVMRTLRVMTDIGRRTGLLDREHSDALTGGISRFSRRGLNYRGLIRWSLSLLFQLRALFFHLGIFIAVLWKGIVQDMAFGWQTTLNVGSSEVFRFIYTLARPWRAIFPPPSAAQVEGSRIILKNGIAGLRNSDLTAWWTFLCMAILVYGVLPRFLLLFYSILRRRISLARISFNDPESRQLMLKMKTPEVDVGGNEPPGESIPLSVKQPVPVVVKDSTVFDILVPSNREDLLDKDSWHNALADMWSASPGEIVPVSLDEEEDSGFLDFVSLKYMKERGLILVFEGWRPFTAAAGLYCEYLQSRLPADTLFFVTLAARPGRGFNMERRDLETCEQWKRLLPAASGTAGCQFMELKGWAG